MKHFDWTRYTKRIAVKAPLPLIYDAWTTSQELERWFLEEVKFYDTDNNLIGKQAPVKNGFTYKWKWHLYDDILKDKMLEANGKDFLRFKFDGESIVEIRLTTDRHFTIVELTHKNIPTDDESKQLIRLGCASGWTFYLINLKSIYEGGLDLRNKDEYLPTMINN